jgi:UDP-galactopyranose mutase
MDTYPGIPMGGYTKMIEKMQEGIEVRLGVDYFENKDFFDASAKTVVFTGAIDEFFKYQHGPLEYRSLRFETEIINVQDYQGNAIVNYTEEEIPYTRICEHKHFESTKGKSTVITREYPDSWDSTKERYYPVNDLENNSRYSKYQKMAMDIYPKYIFGGRLAEYKYYDMHKVIGSALSTVKKEMDLGK